MRLQNLSLVLFPEKFLVRQMIDAYGREVGITFSPILELSTMESMLQMVQLNIGATILPKSYINVNHVLDHRIKIIPIIEPTPQKVVGIVYRNEAIRTLAMDAFISELLYHFRS